MSPVALTSRLRLPEVVLVLAVVSACLALACGAPADTARPTIRMVFAAAVNPGDLTVLMANRAMRAKGYAVEEAFFANSELAAAALARGDVEIAVGGMSPFWAANLKGADLRAVVGRSDNGYQLLARAGVATCTDLHGRPVAVSTKGALPTALINAYLTHCPGTTPQQMSIPNSTDRLSALATGRVDAALLQRVDVWHLQRRAPGTFSVVTDYNAKTPPLPFIAVLARASYLAAERATVVAWIGEKLRADRRALVDPQALLDEARHWPELEASELELLRAESAAHAWHPNGALTAANILDTYRFFVDRGILGDGLAPSSLADLSLLEEALSSVGGPVPVDAPQ